MNGLDYIPVILHTMPPLSLVQEFHSFINYNNTAASGIQKSTQTKSINSKFKEFLCQSGAKQNYIKTKKNDHTMMNQNLLETKI